MSTNQTQNYALHSWEPSDDFLLAEVNENFAALDASARAVFGTYTGSSESIQHIELGFRPEIVFIMRNDGLPGDSSNQRMVLFSADKPGPSSMAVVDDTGFTLNSKPTRAYIKSNGALFCYLALY